MTVVGDGTVLLVEDEQDVRSSVVRLLRINGCRVAAVEHGEAALTWLAAHPKPSAILLDLTMPVMDGWRFRELQRASADYGDVPVILLTAHEWDPRYEALDPAGFFRKPPSFPALLGLLRTLLPA